MIALQTFTHADIPLLRDAYRMGDSYWSGYIMSMLEEEWRRRSQKE